MATCRARESHETVYKGCSSRLADRNKKSPGGHAGAFLLNWN
jgi:hypothetical protein